MSVEEQKAKNNRTEENILDNQSKDSCACEDSNCDCECECDEKDNSNEQKINEMTPEQEEAIKALNEQWLEMGRQIESAKSQAEKEHNRAEEMSALLRGLQTDFDNYRRRNNDSVTQAKEEGRSEILIKIIGLLDVVEQALKMINDETVAEGIKMIHKQMEIILTSYGVKEIEAQGAIFNPSLHNAVEKIKAKGVESGKIIKVFSKGYQLGEKVLRYSNVQVAE